MHKVIIIYNLVTIITIMIKYYFVKYLNLNLFRRSIKPPQFLQKISIFYKKKNKYMKKINY